MTIRTVAAALARAAADFRLAMCKLHEIQFSAPWNPRASGCVNRGL
jgi:hypothetical protein